jgi:hypothetical protein
MTAPMAQMKGTFVQKRLVHISNSLVLVLVIAFPTLGNGRKFFLFLMNNK